MIVRPSPAVWKKERVLFRDTRSYSVPDRWEDMSGPYRGMITLPHHVMWQQDRTFDINDDDDTLSAYQAIIAEGLETDQCLLLNAQRLTEVWAELMLDRRVRSIWEQHFPQLTEVK